METLIQNVARDLQDPGHIRWTLDDLLDYANQVIFDLIRHRPDVSSANITLTLAEGTRQETPENVQQLFRITRNVPGYRAVRYVQSHSLDALLPLWQSAEPGTEVRDYAWHDDEPRVFWVYPPVVAGTKVEAVVSQYAPEVTDPGAAFPIPALYRDIVYHGVLWRAYSRNTDAVSIEKAATYQQLFERGLGIQETSKVANHPARRLGQPRKFVTGGGDSGDQ